MRIDGQDQHIEAHDLQISKRAVQIKDMGNPPLLSLTPRVKSQVRGRIDGQEQHIEAHDLQISKLTITLLSSLRDAESQVSG